MLSKPQHGWCTISISNWSDRASYLTRVALDLLDSLIFGLSNHRSNCVSFDAEGWDYIIVFDYHNVHIIESKDEFELYSFDISRKELALEVYNDISDNLECWVMWDNPFIDVEDYKEATKIRTELQEKLSLLKDLIDKER